MTDEALIEKLSFPVYRRISAMTFLPGQDHQASSLVEMVTSSLVISKPRRTETVRDESTSGGECEQACERSWLGLPNETQPAYVTHGHDRQNNRTRLASDGIAASKSADLRRLLAWCQLTTGPAASAGQIEDADGRGSGGERARSSRKTRNGAAMAVQEDDMAKGQLRSNREKKKPKADKSKSKTSIPASQWAPTRPSTGKKTS